MVICTAVVQLLSTGNTIQWALTAAGGGFTAAGESSRQLAFYIVGLNDLTQNEIDDLYYCVQQYQTEVITGGRQV